jgi:hypothetical protein
VRENLRISATVPGQQTAIFPASVSSPPRAGDNAKIAGKFCAIVYRYALRDEDFVRLLRRRSRCISQCGRNFDNGG